jgi:hypothetical protein
MSVSLNQSLELLQAHLLTLKPTGLDGFEGLVALSLSTLTRLEFRLAKSGTQFGRDASTNTYPFAIAMEAKRYSDGLSLEALLGKLANTLRGSGRAIDLWVLAATVPLGDTDAAEVENAASREGLTALILDWNPPLPRLAVLLAASRDCAELWLKTHVDALSGEQISAIFDDIVNASGYEGAAEALGRDVSAAEVGLDSLRRHAIRWFEDSLADPLLSRRSFNQRLLPAAPGAIVRATPIADLRDAIHTSIETPASIIAVLGDEGVGKSWVVAQWWLEQNDRPIPIVVPGNRVALLNPADPLESLAAIIKQQSDTASPITLEGWRKRLIRWKRSSHPKEFRFVLIVDGLNENPALQWPELIDGMSQLIRELGGTLIVTSRPHFWEARVLTRLPREIDVMSVSVREYDDTELKAITAVAGVTLSTLSPRMRTFLRNPRICSVALSLLPSLNDSDLTVERILLEYWPIKLRERQSFVPRDTADFTRAIVGHARSFVAASRRHFDPTDWERLAPSARRLSPEAAERDIIDIQEGRFLKITDPRTGDYTFRQEALPFALGLMILEDALRIHSESPIDLPALLAATLDPVRGFDEVAEILAAAVALACLRGAPQDVQTTLIASWCELQNVDEEVVAAVGAYIPSTPAPFFKVIESAFDDTSPFALAPLARAFLSIQTHRQVPDELVERAAHWLTWWSRAPRMRLPDPQHHATRASDRLREIDSRLAALSEADRALLDRLTTERPSWPGVELQHLATLLLAGKALLQYAEDLFGWCLATDVSAEVPTVDEELAWLVRMNAVDPEAVAAQVASLTSGVTITSSELMRSSTATLLRLLGDSTSGARAQELAPTSPGHTWRLIETFCDTNPHDPDAPVGSNLDNSRAAAARIDPSEIWASFLHTRTDLELDYIIPALARFEIGQIESLLLRAVNTVSSRRGLALRQMASHLPSISPLLTNEQLAHIHLALGQLMENPTAVEQRDFHWVVSGLVEATLPHLSATEQLDLLLTLPRDMPLYTTLHHGWSPLPHEQLELRLIDAAGRQDVHALKWTMFAARIPEQALSDAALQAVGSVADSSDDGTSFLARRLLELRPLLANAPAVQADGARVGDDVIWLTVTLAEIAAIAAEEPGPDRAVISEELLATLRPGSPLLHAIVCQNQELVAEWVKVLLANKNLSLVKNGITMAYAVASAWAHVDAESAFALWSHAGASSVAKLIVDGIKLSDASLFAAPDTAEFASARVGAFRCCMNDALIASTVAAVEQYGDERWLDTFCDQLVQSATPADVALALTIAGLRNPNEHSPRLLDRSVAGKFLTGVKEYARKAYRRDMWARHWIDEAVSAADGSSFWRAGVLAQGVVDSRTSKTLDQYHGRPFVQRFGGPLSKNLERAAEKRSKSRKETLFGLRAPARDLAQALQRT